MTIATENLPDDIAALKQIIAGLTRDAVVAQAEIAKLNSSWRAIGVPSLASLRKSWRATSLSSN